MARSHDALGDAITSMVHRTIQDPSSQLPVIREFLGTFIAAESSDADSSIVQLQGGGDPARFVPKTYTGTLSAGQTVLLQSSPTVPMRIVGVLKGNIQDAAVILGDTEPPTPPTGLGSGGSPTSSAIPLAWGASTDTGSGISAYDVYNNGYFYTTVSGLTATVAGLAASTSYTFTVKARDAAGNVSQPSNSYVGTTAAPPAPPSGGLTYYQKTWAATWSGSYNYDGDNTYDSFHGSQCYQGVYGSGNQKSMIGFDSASIVAATAGATALNAQVYLVFAHWWSNAGGTAVLGTHGASSRPGSFSGTTDRWRSGNWPRGGGRWVDISAAALAFQSGSVKGIVLGPGPSSSTTYYGYAYGAGQAPYTPVLRIGYWK